MKLWISAALVLASAAAYAQQPYAGMQTRPVKALSEQQTADLRAGRGMGLALAAELNGYPGPLHVLELADQLDLTADQRTKVQQLFDAMKAEAIPVGTKLIEQEAELDRLVRQPHHHGRPAQGDDVIDRGDAGRAARHPPEVSPLDRGTSEPASDAALCPVARLYR